MQIVSIFHYAWSRESWKVCLDRFCATAVQDHVALIIFEMRRLRWVQQVSKYDHHVVEAGRKTQPPTEQQAMMQISKCTLPSSRLFPGTWEFYGFTWMSRNWFYNEMKISRQFSIFDNVEKCSSIFESFTPFSFPLSFVCKRKNFPNFHSQQKKFPPIFHSYVVKEWVMLMVMCSFISISWHYDWNNVRRRRASRFVKSIINVCGHCPQFNKLFVFIFPLSTIFSAKLNSREEDNRKIVFISRSKIAVVSYEYSRFLTRQFSVNERRKILKRSRKVCRWTRE